MFRIRCLVLLLSIFVSIALSASIVIYQQGMALVNDRIDTTSQIFKIPVSSKILPDSFTITPIDKISKMEFHKGEKISLEKYYESYVGSRIKFVLEDGTVKNFLVLSVEPLIFKDIETKEVYFNPNGYPIFPSELYMDSKNYFIVKTSQPVNSLNFSYLTDGIGWKARYSLILKTKNKLEISGYFNIINQLDMGFSTYNVYLLAGEIYRPQSPEGEKRFMKTLSFAPTSMGNFEQPMGQKTGYRIYRVDISNIPKKSNISIPIIQRELNYRKKFLSRNPGENYLPVDMAISVENIPIDLPAGEVNIYDLVDNIRVLSGASTIRQISKGDKLEVVYGRTSDVLCKKVVKSTSRISKISRRDLREISLKNLSDKTVAVEIYDYIPNITAINVNNPNVDFVLQSKSEVKFIAEVPAGEEFSFQYTVEYGY